MKGEGRSDRRRHIFTVDVEEYFQVHAFEGCIKRGEWDAMPSRVHRSTETLLEMLDLADARGTFFVLGWIADRYPDLVRRIAGAGHEIASHGWEHLRVTEMSPEEFRQDVRRTRELLEDLTNQPVVGFRAASFSIVEEMEWPLRILVEEGYRYDSSLIPALRFGPSSPETDPDPHRKITGSGPLLELPVTTLSVAGARAVAAGGAYFRHFPYGVVRRALSGAEERDVPGVFYMHPWELDVYQPRLSVPWLARLRHYRGLDRMRERLARLLQEFDFVSAREAVLSGSRIERSGEEKDGRRSKERERPPLRLMDGEERSG